MLKPVFLFSWIISIAFAVETLKNNGGAGFNSESSSTMKYGEKTEVESYAKQSGHSHPLLPSYVIQADKGEKGDSGPRGRRGEQGEKGIKGADEKPFPLYIGSAADQTTCSTIFPLYNRYFCTVIKGTDWDDSRSFCQAHGMDLFVPYTDGDEQKARDELIMVMDALRVNALSTVHSYWVGGSYDDTASAWKYVEDEDNTHLNALLCAGSSDTSGYALVINKNGVSTGCFGRLSKTDTEETSSGTTYPLRAFCESKTA